MSALRKLLFLFDRRDKQVAAGLLAMMLVGALLEALGIGLIMPFIALINDPAAIERYGVLRWLYRATGPASPQQFLLWAGVALLLLYAFKAVYLGVLYWLQYRFIFGRHVRASTRLLSGYLHTDYAFHLRRNSAELLRNVNSEVLWVFMSFMVPLSTILIEGTVVVVIVTMLLVVRPLPALAAVVILGGATVLFYRSVRRRIGSLGEQQQEANARMIQWVNQGLGGVKEAKVLGRERFFVDAYRRSSLDFARATQWLRTVSEVPRLAIEVLAVASILFVLIFMLVRGYDTREVLPTLGLFAMAAIRLMPSLNRIVVAITNVRFYTPSINVVFNDLQELASGSEGARGAAGKGTPRPTLQEGIELREVSFGYPGAERPALHRVSLRIEKGSSVAFVGPSGAGKTTLVDIVLGLLIPTSGQVLVDGRDIREDPRAWQRLVGYIPQPIYLSDDSIRRNVAFGLPDDQIDDEAVWRALAAAQLTGVVRALPEGLDTFVGERGVRISGGQRQRIGIARALYHDPPVLVLDEATAALDNETEREVTRAVTALSREKTVITIAHRLSTVRDCDLIVLLKDGRIAASASYEVLSAENADFRAMVTAGSV